MAVWLPLPDLGLS